MAQPFHSSCRLLQGGPTAANKQTHYETLNVPFNASAADIKKSFYKLSKLHHPDLHPKDSSAPSRFMRISEAYSVLSQDEKRTVYDRDVMRHHPSLHARSTSHHNHHHRPNASYHSTGPAGGRPASGLSRRRTAFRGPPPSFFRNTGAGQGAAYTPGGGDGGSGGSSTKSTEGASRGQGGGGPGFGPGNVNRDDTGTRSQPETPHFDWDSAERTNRQIDERIAQRRAAAAHGKAFANETSTVFGFLVMTAALVAGVVGPVMIFGSWQPDKPRAKANKKETA